MSAPSRRMAGSSAGLFVVAIALFLSALSCGVPVEDSTHPIRDSDVPYELLEPAATTSTTLPNAGTTTTTTVAPSVSVPLYFVRNDRIERRVRSASSPVGVAGRLTMLTDSLPSADTEAGFRSAVPPGSFTSTAPQVRGGVATVDLSHDFTAVPAKEQSLAFAQITYTLTDLPGIGQVAFTLNGEPMSALDDEGVAVTGSVTVDTYSDLYAS